MVQMENEVAGDAAKSLCPGNFGISLNESTSGCSR